MSAINGDTITIQNGQTLSQIAEEYGVSVAAIQAANNLKGTNIIAGTELIIPFPEPEFSNDYTNNKLDKYKFSKKEIKENSEYSEEKIALANSTNKKLKDQVARLTVNKKSGYVQINLKQDITADELKELYNIPDGILKHYNDLEFEWKDTGDEAGHQYKDWGNPTFYIGESVIVPPSSFEYLGFFRETWEALTR